jgi:hypothetical protein
MVTLPADFVAIRFQGYFWNLKDQRLYSMKVTGVLRPLAGPCNPNPFNNYTCPGYMLSVDGRKRSIGTDYLKKLKLANSTVPMENK